MRPLSLVVTAGQRNDAAWLEQVLDAVRVPRLGQGRPRKRPTKLRLDRAYGFNKQRRVSRRRGIRCISPEREDAKKARLSKCSKGGRPPAFDKQAVTTQPSSLMAPPVRVEYGLNEHSRRAKAPIQL